MLFFDLQLPDTIVNNRSEAFVDFNFTFLFIHVGTLQKFVANVCSWASHIFCERDRHLFIFGKSSLPMVFFRLRLVE